MLLTHRATPNLRQRRSRLANLHVQWSRHRPVDLTTRHVWNLLSNWATPSDWSRLRYTVWVQIQLRTNCLPNWSNWVRNNCHVPAVLTIWIVITCVMSYRATVPRWMRSPVPRMGQAALMTRLRCPRVGPTRYDRSWSTGAMWRWVMETSRRSPVEASSCAWIGSATEVTKISWCLCQSGERRAVVLTIQSKTRISSRNWNGRVLWSLRHLGLSAGSGWCATTIDTFWRWVFLNYFVRVKNLLNRSLGWYFQLAAENEGIVVSNDNYRDLVQESCEFKRVVEDRILMYSFVSDRFMPPDDPLGRSGPTLENFLRIQPKKGDLPPPCPYGKKCTYGTKCKFNHPERGTGPHKSVSERLSEHAQRHLSARNALDQQHVRTPLQGKSLSVPLNTGAATGCSSTEQNINNNGSGSSCGESMRKALCRTRSNVVPTESQSSPFGQPYSPTTYNHCKQQLQPHPGSSRLPVWPPSADSPQGFPKSHTVENLSCENPSFSIPPSTSQQQQQQNTNVTYGQQQRSMWSNSGRSSTSVSPNGMHSQEDADGVNLHRKLHRQLTLNPSGCDPRIYQIQRGMRGGQSSQCGSTTVAQSPHRPLEPSRSSHCGGTPWELQHHQHHGQHQVSPNQLLSYLWDLLIYKFSRSRMLLESHRPQIPVGHGMEVHRRHHRPSHRSIYGHRNNMDTCRVRSNSNNCRSNGAAFTITWRAYFPRNKCKLWCRCIRTRRIPRRYAGPF